MEFRQLAYQLHEQGTELFVNTVRKRMSVPKSLDCSIARVVLAEVKREIQDRFTQVDESLRVNMHSMRRIPYRIILPVVQLALYLVLVWLGCYYRQTWQAQFEHWITSRPVAATEFIPGWVDGPVSFEEQLAFGINAPPYSPLGWCLDDSIGLP